MSKYQKVLNQHYELQVKLKENPGKQTWKAIDLSESIPKPVILKLLAFYPQIKWSDLKLFEREARILQNLFHSCIPKYRDNFTIESRFFWFCLVQDYIAGNSLQELIDKGKKFSEAEVRNIATSILDILIYLHELSPVVLHRDIKPSNIILGEDQKIYLVDFGSVQACAAVEGATFTIVGTYGYTPIEQFGGRAVPASDLYALGATLIHLLTGTAPADLPQQNMRIQFRQYISLSTDLIDWIEILTHPNVDQRFPTAQEAFTALEKPQLIQPKYQICKKPPKSRIQLTKTPTQLQVNIPKRGWKVNDSLILLGIIVLYGATIPFGLIVFPFVILYWLMGLIPIIFFLLPAFGHIELSLDRRRFSVKWKLLRLRYRLVKGYTAIIHNISENIDDSTTPDGNSFTTIQIQAGRNKYQLCGVISPISAVERQWLIQELNEWLGMN